MSLFGDILALLRGQRETGTARAVVTRAPDQPLPFDPPLGTPIRYAYQSQRRRHGMVQTTSSHEEMTLFAADTGYRARWVTLAASHAASGPGAEQIGALLAAMNRLAADTLGRPLLIDLDPDGDVLGVANLADWRATQGRLLSGLAGAVDVQFSGLAAPERAQVAAILAAVASHYAEQSDEQLENDMLETAMMTLHCGIALPVGDTLAFDLARPARPGDALVSQRVRIGLDRNRLGTWARLHMTASADPDDMARLARQHTLSLLESAGINAAPDTAAAFPQSLAFRERTQQLIALPSGLVQRAHWHREIIADGRRHRVETRSIRRLE